MKLYFVAVVLLLLCASIPTRVTACTGLTLTSSVAGRHACLSEVVTFTCTAQGHIIFWGNEEFGEITVHYLSPPTGGQFQAVVENYDFNNNCLVSSLTLRATASRNRTRVVCTNRDRSLSEPLSLHIMNITLDHLTVVPLTLSTVQLEWKVVPTDGHHCIIGYNIQAVGPNGSQWGRQISGENDSFLLCGVQLEPSKEYTYSVTANISSTHTGPTVKHTSNVEVQDPNPPTNLSALMTSDSQGFQVYIEWKAPSPAALCSPVTGYLLHYHFNKIRLPPNTTSYVLNNVTEVLFNITVASMSKTGSSRNNPSVRLAIPCKDSLVTTGHYGGTQSIFTRVLTAVEDTGVESSCMATPQRCSDCSEPLSFPFSNQTDCTESTTNSTPPITLYIITAVISGVVSFCSGILFAGVCNCILQFHEQWRVDRKSSKCTTGVTTQQRGDSPEYEEISTPESGSQVDMQLQQNAAYLAVQSSH